MSKFCGECGTALAEGSAFCSVCGTRVGSPDCNIVGEPINPTQVSDRPPSHQRSVFYGIGVAIARHPFISGFLVLLLCFLVSYTPPRSTQQSAEVPVRSESAPVIHGIGENFTVGYWTYVVNGVNSQTWLPDMNRMKACDSGNCVAISLTIRNDDTTSSTRPVAKLVDSAGREFSETDTWSDAQLSQLQQLNPGVSKRGYIYFDAPRGRYQLKVSGGYESGKDALVDLP